MTEQAPSTEQRWTRLIGSRVSRRSVIRGGVIGAAGLTAAALIGCGDDDDEAPAPAAATQAPAAATEAATPVPTAAIVRTATPTATAAPAATTAAATATAPPAPARILEPTAYDYIENARADGAPFAYGWADPDKEPVKGGILTYGTSLSHSPFDNITSGGGLTQSANTMIGDMLVGYHHGPDFNVYQMELNPDFGLATGWEVAPDGLSLTFALREANFHNVAPVNGRGLVANDVAQAYTRMQNGRQKGLLLGLQSAEAVDDRTVRFNMERPNADILVVAGNRETPIYPPEVYDQGIADTTPIGTGAGILDKENTSQDQRMVFVANPDYWGGAPLLDAFHFDTIKDSETRKAAFRTGQTHYGLPTLRLSELDALWESVPGTNVMSNPSLMGIGINAVNSNVAPFNDVRVRRALKLGMDVDRYLAIRFPGQGFPDSLPAFGWPFYSDSYPGRAAFGSTGPYDPEEAAKLIAAAGVQEGHKVRLRSPAGFTNPGPDTQLIFEDMRALGFEPELLPADAAAFSKQYYSQGFSDPAVRDADMIQGWSTAAPTANGYFWENIHSQSSVQHFNVVDPLVDDLADRQFGEFDPDVRRGLFEQIIHHFNEEAYWMDKIPASAGVFVVRPEVRHVRFHGPYIGIHSFWDWGYAFHKTWLDNENLDQSLTVDLRG